MKKDSVINTAIIILIIFFILRLPGEINTKLHESLYHIQKVLKDN
jgi:hypothetical protein